MRAQGETGDRLLFAEAGSDEAAALTVSRPTRPPWRVMIADDDSFVHEVTTLALGDFEFDGRRLEFLHAYSAAEAERVVADNDDLALAFIDMVMESDTAGIDLARGIRERVGNPFVRLVMRTGQPSHDPEGTLLKRCDINDYKTKTDCTADLLLICTLNHLRSYRDIRAIETGRHCLRRVLDALAARKAPDHDPLVQSLFEQLLALLHLDVGATLWSRESSSQEFTRLAGPHIPECLSAQMSGYIAEASAQQATLAREMEYVFYARSQTGHEYVLCVASQRSLSNDENDLLQCFVDSLASGR